METNEMGKTGILDPSEPQSIEELQELLSTLRRSRHKYKHEHGRLDRRRLSPKERIKVLSITAGRCHICGGEIRGHWQADHVLAHSGGGGHREDNYLPAHSLCNNYRWDYQAEEFQLILKIGVWTRTQIERDKPLGRNVASAFLAHESRRRSRRRSV